MLCVLEKKNTEEVAWLKAGVWKLRGIEVRMEEEAAVWNVWKVLNIYFLFVRKQESGKWKFVWLDINEGPRVA